MNNPVQHRVVLHKPDGYAGFRFRYDPTTRVNYLEGRKGETWEVVGLRFNANEWDTEQVRAWLDGNDFAGAAIEQASATAPPVTSWQKVMIDIAQEGPIVDSNGNELDISLTEHLQPMIEAFAEEQARGADLPEVKYTHDDGDGAKGIGHLLGPLEWDAERGWMVSPALIHDSEAAWNIQRGHGRVSLEAYSDDAYGDREYSWVLSAVAVLPPGTKPAVPGAGAQIAAGKGKGRGMLHKFTMGPLLAADAGGAGGGDGEPTMADLTTQIADLAKAVEGLTGRLGGVEATLEKMKPGDAGDDPAATDAGKLAQSIDALSKRIDAMEGSLSDAEVKAELDKLQSPENFVLTKGAREKIEEQLKAAGSPAEKRAVLTTAALLGKSMKAGERTLEIDDNDNTNALAKAREDHVAELKKSNPHKGDTQLRVMSASLKPELWADEGK